MDPVDTLPGIGPLLRQRLLTHAPPLPTVRKLKAWFRRMQSMDSSVQREWLLTMTENPRADMCMEGYVVRKHNRRALETLVKVAQDVRGAESPAWWANLMPEAGLDRSDPRGARWHWQAALAEGGEAHPYARIEGTQRVPARAIPSTRWHNGYDPLSKSSLQGKVEEAQRDAILRDRSDPAFNRTKWPCNCFQSVETCKDFGREGNLVDAAGRKIRAPCKWADGRCKEAT